MKRMWIDQPSTLQLLHDYHGTNVLADYNDMDGIRCTVYHLEGGVTSMMIPTLCLSPGWAPASEDNKRIAKFKAENVPHITLAYSEFMDLTAAKDERDYLLKSDIAEDVKHELELGHLRSEV